MVLRLFLATVIAAIPFSFEGAFEFGKQVPIYQRRRFATVFVIFFLEFNLLFLVFGEYKTAKMNDLAAKLTNTASAREYSLLVDEPVSEGRKELTSTLLPLPEKLGRGNMYVQEVNDSLVYRTNKGIQHWSGRSHVYNRYRSGDGKREMWGYLEWYKGKERPNTRIFYLEEGDNIPDDWEEKFDK